MAALASIIQPADQPTTRQGKKARAWSAVVVYLCLPGCLAIYGHRDVSIRVLDAESCEPIHGANVEIKYIQHELQLNTPAPVISATDAEGRAYMRLAVWDHIGKVSAPGYLTESYAFEMSFSEANVVHLFRMPRPKVTYVVPQDFTGLLRVQWEYTPPPADWVGQRRFTIRLMPDIVNQLPRTGLASKIHWFWSPVQYPDGQSLELVNLVYTDPDDDGAVRAYPFELLNRRLLYIGTEDESRRIYAMISAYQNKLALNPSIDRELFNDLFEERITWQKREH